jgi:predicted kinase
MGNLVKEIIILVGNIGTGKTTITKQYSKKGYIVISRDQLRYAIGGGDYIFNPEYEEIIWETGLKMFEDFIYLGKNIIIDEVSITKILRKRYIPIAKRLNYHIHCIVLPQVPMKVSVERRLQSNHADTDKETWIRVWKNFNKMYEEPIMDEGFDKITYLPN